jgi:hypothetical protein
MRNLLETSSVAQSLDGVPSDGEPAFPRVINLAMPEASGKFCDHSNLPSVFRAVGKFAMRSPPPAKVNVHGYSSSPEWFVGLVHRLPPREADVVEQTPIIGKIAKGGAPPASFGPAQQFVQQPQP